MNKINDSYSDCNDDLAALQANLDSNEIVIRDLRYQVERLTKQRDIFKRMVDDGSSKAKASTGEFQSNFFFFFAFERAYRLLYRLSMRNVNFFYLLTRVIFIELFAHLILK